MHNTLRLRASKVFGMQLYKNNACALFLCILSVLIGSSRVYINIEPENSTLEVQDSVYGGL